MVENLDGSPLTNSKVRDYVDLIEDYLDSTDHIYKGESDGEDLSSLSDETIREKLRDRIYDSSLTVVMISPGMKVSYLSERDQWIPWEISFSLKETSRHTESGKSVTSKTNAMLAIVLPDENGSYSYFLEGKKCCDSGCTINHTDRLFLIHRRNMFNKTDASKRNCIQGDTIWSGEHSYISPVRWSDFILDPDLYIDRAYSRRDDISSYEICKVIE